MRFLGCNITLYQICLVPGSKCCVEAVAVLGERHTPKVEVCGEYALAITCDLKLFEVLNLGATLNVVEHSLRRESPFGVRMSAYEDGGSSIPAIGRNARPAWETAQLPGMPRVGSWSKQVCVETCPEVVPLETYSDSL